VKPRQLKLNAHRTLEYFTPEDVASMRADQERMDWLIENGSAAAQGLVMRHPSIWRHAIDAARKGSKP
jgi:hypothetical protein